MPIRQARHPIYSGDDTVGDARSRIEALFGSPPTEYPVLQRHDEIELWRSRELEPAYAMVFFDSVWVRTRDGGLMRATRLLFALGILDDGTKDIIGVWIEQRHDTALWSNALSQLQARGVAQIGIAVAEEDAAVRTLRARCPSAQIVHSIGHLVEASVDHLPLAARRPVAAATLRFIIAASSSATPAELLAAVACHEDALAAFWRDNWCHILPILVLPVDARDLVCTTSAAGSIVEKLRRRGLSRRTNYVSTTAAIRELAFVLRDASTSWRVAPRKWAAVRHDLRA